MRILDRYVLVSFIKNYLIAFLVLIGLYIVLDMVINFDELAEVQNRAGSAGGVDSAVSLLRGLVDYYFYQSFLIFVHLSGVIPVVAAAFTLLRLQRFNELTATLAAGVPLLRTAFPIILCGVIINIIVLPVDQEILIPSMIPKLTRKHDEVQAAGKRTYLIRAMQDDQNGLVNVARYHPTSAESDAWMEYLDVIIHDENYQPVSHLSADRADWDPDHRQWKLTNGLLVSGLKPGEKRSDAPAAVYKSDVTPDEVALFHSGEYIDLLSTAHIDQLLQRPKSYGTIDLQRVKHMRFTTPILNVILLLLAVPSILTREPGRLKQGIMQCAIFTGAAMAAVFVAQQLAGTPPMGLAWVDKWPAIMAWMPALIFLPVAVWLLDRVKT